MTAKYSGNLERDVLGAQFFDQISGLLERDVAVVVAMDEQHGGAPIRNACDWALLTVVCLGASIRLSFATFRMRVRQAA